MIPVGTRWKEYGQSVTITSVELDGSDIVYHVEIWRKGKKSEGTRYNISPEFVADCQERINGCPRQ